MKILHAPYNIVNIPFLISRATRNLGHSCDVMSLYSDWREHDRGDYVLFRGTTQEPEPVRFYRSKCAAFSAFALSKYDIFQFHQRVTLLPRELDIPLIRGLKKSYFIYHHGSDVMGSSNYLKHVPHAKWAKGVFVSTPNLYDFVPKSAVLIPQAINLASLEQYILRDRSYRDGVQKPVVITHAIGAAYAKEHKGSFEIVKAIEFLKESGLKIDFRFFIGERQNTVLKEIANADIHIDQMKLGWHGTITAEAMALGTPTVCYIRPNLEEYSGRLPIFRANKDNLAARLEELVQDTNLRKQLSRRGREYARKVHSAPRIAEKLLDIYAS